MYGLYYHEIRNIGIYKYMDVKNWNIYMKYSQIR
jgi:hypothetical protein